MYIKKNLLYILISAIIILIAGFFAVYLYKASIYPIQLTLKSTNPQLINVSLDKSLLEKTLNDYEYTFVKKTYFYKEYLTIKYKKINITIVPNEQTRFAYTQKGKIVSGTGLVDHETSLFISLYVSKEYIEKLNNKKNLSQLQKEINRLLTAELYVNSPKYRTFIAQGSGVDAFIKLGEQKPKSYILIK